MYNFLIFIKLSLSIVGCLSQTLNILKPCKIDHLLYFFEIILFINNIQTTFYINNKPQLFRL